MKKRYSKPAMQVEKVQQMQIICTSGEVTNFGGDAGLIGGGPGSGPVRARQRSLFWPNGWE